MFQSLNNTNLSDEFEKYKTLLQLIDETYVKFFRIDSIGTKYSNETQSGNLYLRQSRNFNEFYTYYDYYLNQITKSLVKLDNSDYLVSKLIVANIISAYNIYDQITVIKFTNFIQQFLGDKVILNILFLISELQPLLLEPIEYDSNLTDETIIIDDNTFIKLFSNILNYHWKQLNLKIHNLYSTSITSYLQQNCLTLTEFNNQTRQLINELMSPELYTLMKMLVFMANKKQLSPYQIDCCSSLAVPSTFPVYDRKLELLDSIIVVVNTLQNHFNTSTIKYHSLFNSPNFSKELYYLTFNSTPYIETDIIKLEDRVKFFESDSSGVNNIDINFIITTYDSYDDSDETKDNYDSLINLYSTMFQSDTQCYQYIPGLEVTYDIDYSVSETVLVSFLESNSLFPDVIDYNETDNQIYEPLTRLLSQGYETLHKIYLSLNIETYDTLVDYLNLRLLLTFNDTDKYISRRILRYFLLVHQYQIGVVNGNHYKLYSSVDYLTLSDNPNSKPSIAYLISKDIMENSKFNLGFTLTTSDKTNVNYTILNQDYKNGRILSSLIFSQSKNNDELFGI